MSGPASLSLGEALEALAATVEARRGADPAQSYTAQLLAAGVGTCAKKLGEEALEAALAAVSEDEARLAAEAGDVLYHLLVLLAARGVEPAAVARELAKRTGQSGLAEKAGRSG